MRRSSVALLSAALSLSGGCTSGFDTESAFAEEVYLCDEDSSVEWQARVEECRVAYEMDESCLGVISFRGVLQDLDVVLDAPLDATAFQNLIRSDLSFTRGEVSLVGFAPYFGFELTIDSIGGPVPSGTSRSLDIGVTPDRALRYDDTVAEAAMRLSAGSDSADINFVNGTVDVELQELNEIAGRFRLLGFRAGNDIEGCFHAFDPDPSTRLETP